MKPEEFVQKLSALLNIKVGAIIAKSLLDNNLSKINKDAKSLSRDDCRSLVEKIVKGASVFVTKDEAAEVQADMEKLLKEFS